MHFLNEGECVFHYISTLSVCNANQTLKLLLVSLDSATEFGEPRIQTLMKSNVVNIISY